MPITQCVCVCVWILVNLLTWQQLYSGRCNSKYRKSFACPRAQLFAPWIIQFSFLFSFPWGDPIKNDCTWASHNFLSLRVGLVWNIMSGCRRSWHQLAMIFFPILYSIFDDYAIRDESRMKWIHEANLLWEVMYKTIPILCGKAHNTHKAQNMLTVL